MVLGIQSEPNFQAFNVMITKAKSSRSNSHPPSTGPVWPGPVAPITAVIHRRFESGLRDCDENAGNGIEFYTMQDSRVGDAWPNVEGNFFYSRQGVCLIISPYRGMYNSEVTPSEQHRYVIWPLFAERYDAAALSHDGRMATECPLEPPRFDISHKSWVM